MNCPICGQRWNYESALTQHVIKKHFLKPRGKFLGQLPVNGILERYFDYALVCWCGWNAFSQMVGPFIPSDYSMAYIAATLHLERSGGPATHWMIWRLEHIDVTLPVYLKNGNEKIDFTTEGGIKADEGLP